LPHQGGAGGQELTLAGDLHHTHTAVGLDGLVGMIAEVGDVDADAAGSLDDAGAGGDLHGHAVNGQMDHLLTHLTATSFLMAKTSGKRFMAERRADWAVSPRPHMDAVDMMRAYFS